MLHDRELPAEGRLDGRDLRLLGRVAAPPPVGVHVGPQQGSGRGHQGSGRAGCRAGGTDHCERGHGQGDRHDDRDQDGAPRRRPLSPPPHDLHESSFRRHSGERKVSRALAPAPFGGSATRSGPGALRPRLPAVLRPFVGALLGVRSAVIPCSLTRFGQKRPFVLGGFTWMASEAGDRPMLGNRGGDGSARGCARRSSPAGRRVPRWGVADRPSVPPLAGRGVR